MEKIRTEEEIESKRKRNGRVFAFFMLIILVGSTAGFAFLSNPGDEEVVESGNYTGIKNIDGQWALNLGNEIVYFSSSPEEAGKVPINASIGLSSYYSDPLYIDSDSVPVNYEIASTLGRYSPRMQEACYGKCGKNLPEKDCSVNLIVYRESADNKVYQNASCIFIEGNIVAVDAFLYRIFGIN